MSIKSRLKVIEGRIPERNAVEKIKPEKTDLLALDYEEYREAVAAWMMSLYVGDQEQAEEMEKKTEYLLETLEPVSKSSQYDPEKCSQLMAVKIVDWMEDNDFKGDINEDRWEELQNELKIQDEQA
ncbi:hypothetical protein [Cytobacillus firmus]|uniref:hypothetical protein n=1 Tax=Cytobacillus firmus TaxID=1399 RepID=UPI00202E5B1F|nr:hypothetical protein [Cytobacillus firmus]URT72718.1 hypothetical protein NAF01_09830 [Cytobacillus firmus]